MVSLQTTLASARAKMVGRAPDAKRRQLALVVAKMVTSLAARWMILAVATAILAGEVTRVRTNCRVRVSAVVTATQWGPFRRWIAAVCAIMVSRALNVAVRFHVLKNAAVMATPRAPSPKTIVHVNAGKVTPVTTVRMLSSAAKRPVMIATVMELQRVQ